MATKLGMTRIFKEDGEAIPVTVIKTEPNNVIHKKTEEKDGYCALVLGFQSLKKPQKTRKFKFVKEFKLGNEDMNKFENSLIVLFS